MYTFKELKRATKQDTVSLPKLKVALLGDTATQLLATAIKGEGILRNYNIELWEAEYNPSRTTNNGSDFGLLSV